MDIVKILEMLGIEDLRKNRPYVFKSILILLLILALFLVLSGPIEKFYNDHFKRESLFDVTIKFYTSDGDLTKPFVNSWLSMGLNSVDMSWDTTISPQGYARYRSRIPSEYKNKKVLLAIESDQYILSDKIRLYGLSDTIKAKVELVPENYHVGIKDSIPTVQQIVSCPKRNPNGVLLSTPNHDKPGENPGHKWVSGYYYKNNNVCTWKKGKWIELTINDCPKNPPNGYVAGAVGTARKGYFWQPGRWVLQDNECTWKAGSWQKKQASPSVDLKPTFAPPLRKN